MTVTLRAMEPEDLDLLYQIENNRELWHVGITNVPYSRYALHDFIAHSTGDIYADKQVRMMVDDSEGNTVGIVDLINYSPQHQRAELGIVIERKYRGKGYGTSAIRQLVLYARKVLRLHLLYAVVSVDNASSVAMLERAGFRRTAELPGWFADGGQYSDAIVMQFFL